MNKDVIIERMITGAVRDKGVSAEDAKQLAGHMVSWLDDLYRLVRFYNDPKEFEEDYITAMLEDFLTNVPRHLDRAKHLYYKQRNPEG